MKTAFRSYPRALSHGVLVALVCIPLGGCAGSPGMTSAIEAVGFVGGVTAAILTGSPPSTCSDCSTHEANAPSNYDLMRGCR